MARKYTLHTHETLISTNAGKVYQIGNNPLETIKVVYRGGQHHIECNGSRHWLVDYLTLTRRPDGKCWCKG